MSKLSVNELTDEAGTGAPSFPNGMSVTGAALTDPEITGGIYLGGTGAANYLDDYEEGAFTPFYDGGDMSISYDVQAGRYIRIGNLCYVNITLFTSSVSVNSVANLKVGGLPFTAKTLPQGQTTNAFSVGRNYRWSTSFSGLLKPAIVESRNNIDLFDHDSNNISPTLAQNSDLTTGVNAFRNNIDIAGVYEVD